MADRNLDAYYYSFEPTGCDAVDAILEAVAQAGAGYHSTEDWKETGSDGESAASRIQAAANASAVAVLALIAENDRLGKIEAERDYKRKMFEQWWRESVQEPFDKWLNDGMTHWIGDTDAAYQAWQYVHENKVAVLLERNQQVEAERDRLKAELEQVREYGAEFASLAERRNREIEALKAELERVRADAEALRGALGDIAEPIAAMQRDLEDGYQLNGAMAIRLSSDPEYLKGIARAALGKGGKA